MIKTLLLLHSVIRTANELCPKSEGTTPCSDRAEPVGAPTPLSASFDSDTDDNRSFDDARGVLECAGGGEKGLFSPVS